MDVKTFRDTVLAMSRDQWLETYLQHARAERHDLIPFPPADTQIVTNGQSGEVTGKGAISIWETMLACIEKVRELRATDRILDYGCGLGRITRILPHYVDVSNIVGADVDGALVASANALLPHISHQKIDSLRPLPFGDGTFDIVFANSVFSHLSRSSFGFALSELSRVLKQSGLLVVSVLERPEMDAFYRNQTQATWIKKILGSQRDAQTTLSKDGFVWGDTGRWDNYGITIVTDEWVSKAFAEAGITYFGGARGRHQGTQNYKVGVKD